MSNETEKPSHGAKILKSAVRATAMVRKIWEEDQLREMASDHLGGEQPHPEPWRIFARESGLAELVKAVEKAEETRHCDYLVIDDSGDMARQAMIAEDDWLRIVAAARRVRE